MKVIIVNTPKGQYSIPLKVVAENRADYYAVEVDGHEAGSAEWNTEVQHAMNDDFDGIDWILNNSNWKDWRDHAEQINDTVKVTEDDFWTSSDAFKIAEL